MSSGSQHARERADQLDRHRALIVERWLQRVQQTQIATYPLPAPELIDCLPEFLARLSEALRRGPAGGDEALDLDRAPTAEVAREHGIQRYRHGFDIRALVVEYTLLLDILFEFFDEGEGRMGMEESRMIVHAITLGIAAAVDQFTAEREADLRASRDALLQAREYERQLIGIVSHDLRNPLGIIMACVDVAMRRQELPSGATSALRRLRSNAERAVRLIGDLLDFTQERLLGHIPVRPEAGDMEALVCAAVEEAALTHPERTIERVGATGPVEGRWDRDRIAQALANLLDNALKFSPADSAVRVETRADGQRVAIAVHNWGPPIPPERLGSVFDVFERADPGASARVSLGLGLHICQQIVRAHGGNLEVRSSVEQGTTFTMTLPRMCSSNGGDVEAIAPSRPVDRAPAHRS